VLAGDGIGPEVTAQAVRALEAVASALDLPWRLRPMPIGAGPALEYGTSLPDATREAAAEADAILLGAVGRPDLDDALQPRRRPGQALLTLRRELDLFANLRPVRPLPPLLHASTLKPEVVEGCDLVIVRELVGGLYFGQPRGIEDLGGGIRRGFNTLAYDTREIRRVARVAFELARTRSGRVCSVDKANVLESMALWRQEVQALHDADYPDLALSHQYVDNCAMQLVRAPRQFDVILTENTFGDILSDCAAMVTGSLGTLPSASLGAPRPDGTRPALYEPVHGSAPDIAGRDVANPVGALLSVELLLRLSFGLDAAADALRAAVIDTLQAGRFTADLCPAGAQPVGTRAFGDHVLLALRDRLADARRTLRRTTP
ncbi:MAG TPA: 3-isopropylmalate dehydrogenase, partial [Ramlibacter sp.]|nr:3-isopropylmalate dehydrogenase [Ramlibacter sp.]